MHWLWCDLSSLTWAHSCHCFMLVTLGVPGWCWRHLLVLLVPIRYVTTLQKMILLAQKVNRAYTGRRRPACVQPETRSHVYRLHNTHQLQGVTVWYTLAASVIVPIPHSFVTFRQHESGTEFPSGLKFLQSEELFTPQHFIWKSKWDEWNTFNVDSYKPWQWTHDRKRTQLGSTDGTKENNFMLFSADQQDAVVLCEGVVRVSKQWRVYTELTSICSWSTVCLNSPVPFL